MRHIKAKLRADGPAEALTAAQRVAEAIVGPADGYASYDITRMVHLDAEGRLSVTPTAELEVHYTFWRSARHGRYLLRSVRAEPRPTLRGAFASLFGGL